MQIAFERFQRRVELSELLEGFEFSDLSNLLQFISRVADSESAERLNRIKLSDPNYPSQTILSQTILME